MVHEDEDDGSARSYVLLCTGCMHIVYVLATSILHKYGVLVSRVHKVPTHMESAPDAALLLISSVGANQRYLSALSANLYALLVEEQVKLVHVSICICRRILLVRVYRRYMYMHA